MHAAVESIVESLCQNGCKAVWSYIEALEAGRSLPETAGLDDHQRQQVLLELKAVMAVYGATSCTLEDTTEYSFDMPDKTPSVH